MIHRDQRRHYESASALGQILWRRGPKEITVGDVDLYVIKIIGQRVCLRIIEHKQPRQTLKTMQRRALALIDQCIRHCVAHNLFGLTGDSGVFIMRGHVEGGAAGHREVQFHGPQTIETLDGQPVATLRTYPQVNNWLSCDRPWTARNESFD
jgi:hypothetical protein